MENTRRLKLQVVVATYNRQQLLECTIRSLLAGEAPADFAVHIIIVDNNSSDGTRETVEKYLGSFEGRLSYRFEGRQGKPWALNTGIAATDSDLVAFIDDDEEIGAGWYQVVHAAFQRPEVDYIGGTTLPKFMNIPPPWLPSRYGGVIGSIQSPRRDVVEFGKDKNYEGILAGGNAVLRRSLLERLGPEPYPTQLGRKGNGLLTVDQAFHKRLYAARARGFFYPDLVVHHHVQVYMLTKHYHRRWCFWNEASYAVHDRMDPAPVPYLFGVPRWYYRLALEGIGISVLRRFRDPAEAFAGELDFVRLAGFFYGKHFLRVQFEEHGKTVGGN